MKVRLGQKTLQGTTSYEPDMTALFLPFRNKAMSVLAHYTPVFSSQGCLVLLLLSSAYLSISFHVGVIVNSF